MNEKKFSTPAFWYGNTRPPLALRALSRVYAGAISLRRTLYRIGFWRSRQAPVPVVVVGNLTVGGAGKTPLTMAIVQRLQEAGFKPGVASRGYGRAESKTPRWVERTTPVAIGGDEPVMIAQRTAVPVRVDRDRAAAALALAQRGCDIVVCDDGLQHYRLARDIEIEVVDGERRYGNGRLLPAGPLRELPDRGKRCDFRVVNLGNAGEVHDTATPAFGEWPMCLEVNNAVPLMGGRAIPLGGFAGHRVHAVAGIGHPERFFSMLRGFGIAVVPHVFPDHHTYGADDLQFGSRLPVLMTEKDAVKCTAFADERCYSVPVAARLPTAFWVAFFEQLKTV